MGTTRKTDTVRFTVKGQVVIPRWLRREFEIKEGTRALIYQEDGYIVLKPMTVKHYDTLQGCLKGSGALKVLMAERKKEREL